MSIFVKSNQGSGHSPLGALTRVQLFRGRAPPDRPSSPLCPWGIIATYSELLVNPQKHSLMYYANYR